MEKTASVIFYSIEKAIKSYRRMAQRHFKKAGLDITVDQWLTLSSIRDNAKISQKELSLLVFKDAASVTRIIELLIRDGYLHRHQHASDKRRSRLALTPAGKSLLLKAQTVVNRYRKQALKDVSDDELAIAKKVMQQIIQNSTK